jgi:hypothetical protein
LIKDFREFDRVNAFRWHLPGHAPHGFQRFT